MNTIALNRYLLLLIFLLEGLITKPQTASIGVKAGLVNSKFVSSSENASLNGFYFGIVTNKRINNTYSIQSEINYCPEGSLTYGLQPVPEFIYHTYNLPPGKIYYGSYKKETILNNMKIPVLAKVTLPINTHFKYYMLFGPYISYLGKAETKTSGTSIISGKTNGQTNGTGEAPDTPVSFDNAWDATNEFRKFSFGAEGGIGFSYGHPFSSTRIFVEGRLDMNISKIHKSESLLTIKDVNSKILALGFLYKL